MRLGSALIAAAASAAALSCGLSQEGIAPPRDRIFYPGAILPESSGERLYVVNSNADLRFNDGTLAVVDLTKVHQVYKDAVSRMPDSREVCPIAYVNQLSGPMGQPEYCCWDALDRNVLNCDERQFIESDATVKIGSFGSAIELLPDPPLTPLSGPSVTARLLVAVRGNASITWVDVSGDPTSTKLACGGGGSSFPECDQAHRVNQVTDSASLDGSSVPVFLPDEPYALALDDAPTAKLLYVGHLRGGYLSAINLLHTPALIGTFPGIFPGDINGSTGVTSMTVVTQGLESGRVLATSRFVPRAGSFAPVTRGGPTGDAENDNRNVFLTNAGNNFVSPLGGAETRGIQVVPGINRTFMLQRTPPALIGFDTSQPGNNVATDVVEICSSPTFLHMHSPTAGASDEQLFVTCFESGEVYVVDPYVPRLVAIIQVGRGPGGLAFAKDDPKFGYVVGFGSNNVSVIDLDPNSTTRYHVVERIGFPNPTPR